ncbi:MAG: hypothetical protein V2A67_04350 [Bacteroidota bacterium]
MKRKFLIVILLILSSIGLATLRSSSIPEPSESTAKVQWFDNLTCDGAVTIAGTLLGGGSGSVSFTAEHPGGSSPYYVYYPLGYAFTSGTVYLTYQYWESGTWHPMAKTWPFTKSYQEQYDVIIEVPIAKAPAE